MAVLSEMRVRARQILGSVLGICVVGYFAYHAVHGQRGFIAWSYLQEKVAAKQRVADTVASERAAWERRVARLTPESIDPDLLDEQARRMLGYAAADEVIILTGSAATPKPRGERPW